MTNSKILSDMVSLRNDIREFVMSPLTINDEDLEDLVDSIDRTRDEMMKIDALAVDRFNEGSY